MEPAPAAAAPGPADSRPSDELADLLGRVALGDRRSFTRLFERTRAHLLGVVLRINRDRAQAEEILQDVFVNVWRAAQTYDPQRSAPMTWLISVARYRAIDSLRRKASEPPIAHAGAASGDGEAEPLDLLDTIACEGIGPEEAADQRSNAEALQRCLQGLGSEQRQAIALAYYRGLSHSEVAEQMAMPLGSVKSWIRRGLLALEGCLQAAGLTGARAVKGGR